MTKVNVSVVKQYGNSTLIAADEISRDIMNSYERDRELVIDLKGSRNPKQHRLLFGLLNFAVEHSDRYANTSDLLVQIKFHLSMVDHVKVHGSNEAMIIPRSISFESMSQADFKNFLNEAIRIITEKFVPNLDGEALQEYYKILDGER